MKHREMEMIRVCVTLWALERRAAKKKLFMIIASREEMLILCRLASDVARLIQHSWHRPQNGFPSFATLRMRVCVCDLLIFCRTLAEKKSNGRENNPFVCCVTIQNLRKVAKIWRSVEMHRERDFSRMPEKSRD